MILNSQTIKEKAEKVRATLTETEALIAEGMVRGQPFDEMTVEFGVSREEIDKACNTGSVNVLFWMLVALCNTKEAEIYRDACDSLKQAATNQSKTIGILSGSDQKTVH